jgi:hypothetical protein
LARKDYEGLYLQIERKNAPESFSSQSQGKPSSLRNFRFPHLKNLLKENEAVDVEFSDLKLNRR